MSEETITITKFEYDQLVDRESRLSALECLGVDNWCGFDEAMAQYREWKNES